MPEPAPSQFYRAGVPALERSDDGRNLQHRTRYERIPTEGEPVVMERTWVLRRFDQEPFARLARAAGFDEVSFRAPGGGPAPPDARTFVARLRKA